MVTRKQLRRIILESLNEGMLDWAADAYDTAKAYASDPRQAAIDDIIELLYEPIKDRINGYKYSPGVCKQDGGNFNCNGDYWAGRISAQLKSHDIIKKANVSDIVLMLPSAIARQVAGKDAKAGSAEYEIMEILNAFNPEQLVKKEIDLNILFSDILNVLQEHGLADN